MRSNFITLGFLFGRADWLCMFLCVRNQIWFCLYNYVLFLGNVYINIQSLETWHCVTPFRNNNVPMRCCSHWVYQQQGWWCCAVATGFNRRSLVMLSNCRHARCAHPSYINNERDGMRECYERAFFFFFNDLTAFVSLCLLYELPRSH